MDDNKDEQLRPKVKIPNALDFIGYDRDKAQRWLDGMVTHIMENLLANLDILKNQEIVWVDFDMADENRIYWFKYRGDLTNAFQAAGYDTFFPDTFYINSIPAKIGLSIRLVDDRGRGHYGKRSGGAPAG